MVYRRDYRNTRMIQRATSWEKKRTKYSVLLQTAAKFWEWTFSAPLHLTQALPQPGAGGMSWGQAAWCLLPCTTAPSHLSPPLSGYPNLPNSSGVCQTVALTISNLQTAYSPILLQTNTVWQACFSCQLSHNFKFLLAEITDRGTIMP